MKRAALAALLLTLAACAAEEPTLEAALLTISLDGEVVPPTRLVARALTHTNDGPLLATIEADLTGRDLNEKSYVLEIVVPATSPFGAETLLSVVAYHDDTPVASFAERVALREARVHPAPLRPLLAECDEDGDGYANCLAATGCCIKDQADYAHDCDDGEPAIHPFAADESCRVCDAATPCKQPGGGPDAGGDAPTCAPACGGRECGEDGCGGSCGSCAEYELCTPAGLCTVRGMTYIPAGTFEMGCNEALDQSCAPSELPQHTVTVSAFEMDTLEVSNADYQACVQAGACKEDLHWDNGECYVIKEDEWVSGILPYAFRDDNQPAICATWAEARNYCESYRCPGCRLCSEAELEMASRGSCALNEGQDCKTSMWKYPWGNDEVVPASKKGGPVGNFADETAQAKYQFQSSIIGYIDAHADTAPVGSFPAGQSRYGVLDLAGNVWEWAADCWHPTYEGAPATGAPWDEDDCALRVRRGGSWVNGAADVRSGVRTEVDPNFRADVLGFRCCR